MKFDLTLEEGYFLVKLARKASEEYVINRRKIDPPSDTPPQLREKRGVFVTLNKKTNSDKKLRGCIGFPYPTHPLVEAVIESSINSSVNDPRFPPIRSEELDHIVFEVSVLTPPERLIVKNPLEYPSKITVGVDGLIIKRGFYSGLLLPQVPVEWGWNSEEFLCQCCLKAGLSPDCWLLDQTEIYTFRAIIFEEVEPKGKVVRKGLERKNQ